MKSVTRFVEDVALRRNNINTWKNNVMEAKPKAQEIMDQLREQTADLLDKRAEAWTSENKLVHAGAAKKLAEELRRKFNDAR